MGTNYYLQTKACPHCGQSDKEKHIGKSSGGWCFALHVEPENGINDLHDWKNLMADPNAKIRDEYGKEISRDEMLDIITNRGREEKWNEKPRGYDSWEDFFAQNHAERGPNGLLRHGVDGNHCLKQGEGTWDCIAGEFS